MPALITPKEIFAENGRANRRKARLPSFAALKWAWGIGLLLIAVWTAGCATAPTHQGLYRLAPRAYPPFEDDMSFDGLAESIQRSLTYLEKMPPDRPFSFGDDQYSAEHLYLSMARFLDFIQTGPSSDALQRFIRQNYYVYRSSGSGPQKEVLFTGYYEPFLKGSTHRNGRYRYPLLTKPADLVTIDLGLFSSRYDGQRITGRYTGQTVVPYYDRRQIVDEGALDGQTRVLAWLADPVDLFFLQIQGSGRIFLNDGSLLHVHYHASNGQPYRSIGRLLIDQDKIPREEMSMQRIRRYLDAHPEEIAAVLNHNPSYVFFKTEEEGPVGFLEVKLTPGRSLAVDYRIFPLPALSFIDTHKPLIDSSGHIHRWVGFKRFVISQDTGGAIRGPARSDLFWGNGDYAEIAAGHMQHRGRLYMLVLKPELLARHHQDAPASLNK